jgi:protein-disulfide isomerase
MDVVRFDDKMAKHVHANRVREDFMSGIRSGVNGTPTFYINGIRYDDSWDEKTLLASIKWAVANSERRQPKEKRRL